MDFMDFLAVIFFLAIMVFIFLVLSPIIVPLMLFIIKLIKKLIETIVKKRWTVQKSMRLSTIFASNL